MQASDENIIDFEPSKALAMPTGSNSMAVSVSDDLEMVDAQALLARALVDAAAPISARAVEAAFFLQMYLGDEGRIIAQQALALKSRQSPGAAKNLREALKSLAALDLLKPFTIGGAGGK